MPVAPLLEARTHNFVRGLLDQQQRQQSKKWFGTTVALQLGACTNGIFLCASFFPSSSNSKAKHKRSSAQLDDVATLWLEANAHGIVHSLIYMQSKTEGMV